MLPETAQMVAESRTKMIYIDNNAYHESTENAEMFFSAVKTKPVKIVTHTVAAAVAVSVAVAAEGLC